MLVYGLVKLDATDFTFQTWERGLAEQELNFRRFGRAFCSLNLDSPQPFTGEIKVIQGTLKAPDLKIVLRGKQLSVINMSLQPGTVSLGGNQAKGPWRELGRNDKYAGLSKVELLPYDVLTFEPTAP